MRHIILFLILALLLCGCGTVSQDLPIETEPVPTAETQLPTTAATEPPDPMQLLLDSMTVEEKVFDPYDEKQVDLSGIVNAKEQEVTEPENPGGVG